jgi:Ca2+/Na+ antiporter
METETILFNICSFLAGLFLLERGADIFIDNTAALAKRLGLREVLIALLTAGAEWEELAVVIVSLVQKRPKLAIGNVIGSNISNVLGAFSLGLMFQTRGTSFDRSSKLYTIILFAVTTLVSVLALTHSLKKFVGAIMVASFAIYLLFVCWSIYRGVLAAPEDMDSDSDSGSDEYPGLFENGTAGSDNVESCAGNVNESTPLFPKDSRTPTRGTTFHPIKLLFGFIALSVSGFILSHSSGDLARAFGISDTVFGATILSFATTLPEKFVAVMSGTRGHSGILIANTVGSNIFLLTLCLGITLLSAIPMSEDAISQHEIYWMWATSASLLFVVLTGFGRPLFGALMLAGYLAFVILELTLFRK